MDPRKLSSFEQEELLRYFFHHMGIGQRQDVMARYPESYRKACGWDHGRLDVVLRAHDNGPGVTPRQTVDETIRPTTGQDR